MARPRGRRLQLLPENLIGCVRRGVTPNTQRITGLEQLLDDTRSIGALAEMIRARCWRLKQLDAKARQVRVQKAQDEA